MVRPMPPAIEQARTHADAVARGERFEFGENWRRFLDVLDDERVAEAERSLREMLGVESLKGRRFLDVGAGSGLFSLAARRLEADRVLSFDFDPQSVACTRVLRRRYFDDDPDWNIEEGSVLDDEFVEGLGVWDIVYSWGVLHHTGDMWRAIDIAQARVADGGLLFVSIYNDQGGRSALWRSVKRLYNRLPAGLRPLLTLAVMGPRELRHFGHDLVLGKPMRYVRRWTDYKRSRGMSAMHDIVDWMGGYPFEVAKPEAVFEFLQARGLRLERLVTHGGGRGCNQYVFRRPEHEDAASKPALGARAR
jgi:2-polyprenyl-6-hydroxyphenyl methylase/3-demethylubiquinone-9 3-methyltransferase